MKPKKQNKKGNRKERALALAERVKLLLGFCFDLVPDIDLLKDTAAGADDRADTVLSMAPILGAFGQDYEELHFKRSLEAKRAKALYNLIETLRATEEERTEFVFKQQKKAQGRATLSKILGGL